MGETRFPLWKEVSTCYHEAVPGHHLQVAQVMYLAEKLSRFQRLFGFVSGHGEGWALYAERLMGELGYLDDPAFEMGMLAAQAMRAVRVVVDIGMHLELPIIASEPTTPARRGPPSSRCRSSSSAAASPRSSCAARSTATSAGRARRSATRSASGCGSSAGPTRKQRKGADFDLKAFHTYALDLGGMGLGPLRDELARF